MGYLLKEALKTICGVNQWSYAVFWKIGCQNPKLLIWEECYYGPVTYSSLPGSSGPENPKIGFEDWSSTEPNNSQLAVQAGNRVHFLVNKMMMDNHVNILGEGLVGRAAFTGDHQWILSQNYKREANPPEVLKEAFQQFSAGMQTIAVIPVLPHGVVQLGSDTAIMENMAFVNGVKTVLQLGCVPSVLLSENYATKESGPKIGVPVCLGNSIPGTSSGRSMVIGSTPLISDSYDYKSSLTETAIYVGQTSCSVGQVLDIAHSTAATFQASNMPPSLVTPHADQCQAKVGCLANTNLPSSGQLANGVVKAEVIPSNPEAWFNQQTSFYIPRSTFDRQPSIFSSAKSSASLSLTEQQISADIAVQSAINNSNLSDSLMMSILGTNAGLGSCQDFVTIQPANTSELNGVAKSNPESLSTLGTLSDAKLLFKTKTSTHHAGSEFQSASSSKSSLSLSKVVENSSTNKLLASGSVNGYHSADSIVHMDLAEMNGRLENDLYQALSVPLSEHDENTGLSECIPGHIHNETKHEYGLQIPSARDGGNEGAGAQPRSGDDLFDILGVDFKNKLFSCSWNNSHISGLDSNITNLEMKNSALVKGSDAAADSYLVNEGRSDSSIFSVIGTDHLLDAVISSKQPSAKQILDDNISCRTTLTNSCSSFLPNASKSGSQVCMSGQMHGELFGFPKSLGKSDMLGSRSFKSGPCKDNAGYSQSSSLYGSQISSWIEQGHVVKPSRSVSTAYSKNPDDASKTNRKRLKPGENPRPRPKDRQMIQDRVKELREIVPNGAKCSIDALLERTIKHMLFLQSVTKHADKLKQSGELKIIGKEGGILIKDNNDGGATWAYEVGSQSMVCPIIVEDLNQPRQMLVEMLCEERGLFLEIADIIRGLGLTILKGVMETRNDKIWARFAVEANRDVTRMEIFMSLVRLLEQTVKNGVVPVHGMDNDTMMVPQFLQATSIPASGRPCSFQ